MTAPLPRRAHVRRRRPWYRQPLFIATVVGEAGVFLLFVVVAILAMSLR